MVASVPEFTIRTTSIDGTRSQTSFAIFVSNRVGAPKLVPLALSPEALQQPQDARDP